MQTKSQLTIHDYNLERITERLAELLAVLRYDSEEQPVFSVYERICINQQRGDLLVFKRYLTNEAKYSEVRFYILPDAIEEKVIKTLKRIR